MLTGLATGTAYYVGVTAVEANGQESTLSTPNGQHTITAVARDAAGNATNPPRWASPWGTEESV